MATRPAAQPRFFERAQPGTGAGTVPGSGISFDFLPSRAGINLVTATVTGEIVVANDGPVALDRMTMEARLISAHADQEAEIRALHSADPGRPAAVPFTLQPGERRRIATVVALPHEAIRALTAGGRPMFVPLVVLTATFRQGGMARRAGHAFAVGVERVDSAKLAPLWLDSGPRTHTQVAARAQGPLFQE